MSFCLRGPLLFALIGWSSLHSLHAFGNQARTSAAEALVKTGGAVVTPERLLEHVQKQVPEVGALRDVSWADNGQRILLNTTASEASLSSESERSYVIKSIEVSTGRAIVLGKGYRAAAAAHANAVAFFPEGSNDRSLTLARASGESICTIHDTDLMSDANGIQAFALTPDGSKLALAVGYGAVLPRRAPASLGEDGAAVRVFDSRFQADVDGGVAVWVTDLHCRELRLIERVAQHRIGRLAWMDRDRTIVAIAGRLVSGQAFPRSDLLAFSTGSDTAWRILTENIGEQARRSGPVSFLYPAPDGLHVGVSYDTDAMPYALRKQLAIVSLHDGQVRAVSKDPRRATGWLDSRTLLMTVAAPHNLLAESATLSMEGREIEIPDAPGGAVPSPDGRRLAWVTNDLYGNSSLSIADLDVRGAERLLRNKHVIWRNDSVLEHYARGERRLIQCKTDDGVSPAAILVLPLGYSRQHRYPLIVDIHGGPQDGLEWEDLAYAGGAVLTSSTLEHDMWAAKGYAVLSPDYRGSGRYGFDKLPRDGSAYARDFQDILCNVDAVVRDGIADPARMAVIGHSHGGAEVNWIVTHSHRFKAAISKEGSYNVDAMVSWGQSGYANQLYTFLYGAPFDHPEHYRRMSVIEAVRGVTTPTMFVEHQGGKRAGDLYAWLFAAWQKQGVDSQLRLYDDPEHVLSRLADQRDVLYASIKWIDRYLNDISAPLSSLHGAGQQNLKPDQ